MNNTITKSFIWKLLERFGVSTVQFVLQIILARLLSPDHYGALSIIVIFTSLANVFIQQGLNTALIQNKEVSEEDYSSVLWISLAIAVVLYAIIYIASPVIGSFYGMPDIIAPMRVLALMLLPGALNSVQLAKVSKEMDFQKVFYSNIGGTIISGLIGIVIAYLGGGLWALVVQTLLNVIAPCIIMWFTVKLKFRFSVNWKRIRILFSYGWKLLVSSLVDTFYQDLRSVVIGKKYDSETLGYYNRGKQFPQYIISAVNMAVVSVMLPAMSAEQDDKWRVKYIMRNSITMSAYIIFPVMAGLAAVAEPLVELLLTEKWLPCVPFMQIYCFSFAFYPVHSCNLQAINAMGRSDIFLRLEIIKKTIGIVSLVIAVMCFSSPIAIAMTGAITTVINCFVNAYPNKKLIEYSYFEQMKDIFPSFVCSIFMFVCVIMCEHLVSNPIITLFIQILVGVVVYIGFSAIIRIKAFVMLKELLFSILKQK